MCIICNLPIHSDTAGEFLDAYDRARKEMAAATTAMRACSQDAILPEHRKRYDQIHKMMVRLQREWNSIEQLREQHPAHPQDTAPKPSQESHGWRS